MNKNVPNIINTENSWRFNAYNTSQSFRVHSSKSSDSCPTSVRASWLTPPKAWEGVLQSQWLAWEGWEQQDTQSLFVVMNPSQWGLKVAFGEPGAAQVSSLLEKEGAKQIPVLSQGITLNLLTRSCGKNADCRAALNLRARSCFSVCTFWSRNTSSQSCISYFVGPSTCTAERIPIPLKSMGVLLLKRIKPGTWPAFGNWNVVVTRSLCGHYGFHRLQRQWFECSCYQPYRKIRSCRMHSWVWLAAGML